MDRRRFLLVFFFVVQASFCFAWMPGFSDPFIAKIFCEASELIRPSAGGFNLVEIIPQDTFYGVVKEFIQHGRSDRGACRGPYIKKCVAQQNDIFIMIGDLHGNARALIKNLLYLKVIGLIDRNLVLSPNVKLVFLGDLADRGMYGSEVWYIALSIANKNRDGAFILRGNHETEGVARRYGFAEELELRYGMKLEEQFLEVFSLCPSALFININGEYVQANHGGMPVGNIKGLSEFLTYGSKATMEIDSVSHRALLWNDYGKGGAIKKSSRGRGIHQIGVERAKFLHERDKIKAVFHGHQHTPFAVSCYDLKGESYRLPGNSPVALLTSHVYTCISMSDHGSGFGLLRIGPTLGTSLVMSVET